MNARGIVCVAVMAALLGACVSTSDKRPRRATPRTPLKQVRAVTVASPRGVSDPGTSPLTPVEEVSSTAAESLALDYIPGVDPGVIQTINSLA